MVSGRPESRDFSCELQGKLKFNRVRVNAFVALTHMEI